MKNRQHHPQPWLSTIALAAVLSACATTPADPPAPPVDETPKLIGRIASVPADKRFVLIQSYGTWNVESGTVLTTRGPEQRSANLLATGESLGQFAAADLQSGLVAVGDAVYSRHVPKPAEPPAPPASNDGPATLPTPETPAAAALPER